MTVVGFSFTKILAERKEFVKGKINISNNIAIKDVGSADLALGPSKQNGLKIDYTFKTTYQPNIGNIEMEGTVIYMVDEKRTKEISDSWKKDKKLPKDVMTDVLNTVLQRCNIQSLVLSREINIPPPIPLPRVGEKTQTTADASQAVKK